MEKLPTRFEAKIRRWHPWVLAALRASARRRPPPKPCSLRCATRFVTPEGVRLGEVVVVRRVAIERAELIAVTLLTPPGEVDEPPTWVRFADARPPAGVRRDAWGSRLASCVGVGRASRESVG